MPQHLGPEDCPEPPPEEVSPPGDLPQAVGQLRATGHSWREVSRLLAVSEEDAMVAAAIRRGDGPPRLGGRNKSEGPAGTQR